MPNTQTTTFKGARYVTKFADPIEWDSTRAYEAIEAVQHNAFTYISKQPVPAGVQIDNDDFWLLWADPNAQMEQLRDTVEEYKDLTAVENVHAFDTVALMQAGENLENGSVCHTNGFHSAGDGGAAWYKISDTGTVNGKDVIGIPANDNPTLYAHLINAEEYIIPEMLGAHGDGESDDGGIIQYALDHYKSVKLLLKTYGVSETIIINNNNVSLVGASSVLITASEATNPTCSCLKWIGESNNDKAILLCSATSNYIPNTNYPLQGLTVKNVAFNGNNSVGFGLYVSFMGYSGCIDYIYAQGCVSAGILIANAWMVNFGYISAWFNGIGVVLGKDVNGTNRSINECTFTHIIGHSANSSFNVISGLSSFAGTGIVLKTAGAVRIDGIDIERNTSCGIDITSSYGVSIGEIWTEFNAATAAGIAIKNTGNTDIDVVTIGALGELIVNKGRMDIGILNAPTGNPYYPFEGSNVMSVRIGSCSSNLYTKESIKSWDALIVEFMKWAEHDFVTNETNTQPKVVYPHSGIATSLVIVPKNSFNETAAGSFIITANGNTLTVPSMKWDFAVPEIINCYPSANDYGHSYSFGISGANSDALQVQISICSVKYFYNQPWTQLQTQHSHQE